MARQWIMFISVWLLGVHSSNCNPLANRAEVATELIILHNNDMHARFEQTNVNSGKCSEADANTNKCYGGFARVAYEVRKYREEAKNGGTPVFYLNAGDTYTGTPWFTIFKDNITAAFLNKLQPDAISLGNHEFDENVEGLIPLLNNVDFPVLACNLDLTKVPELAATKSLASSTVLETNGVKIGVIGYLTPETKDLSLQNNVEFKEEIVSINAEAAKLKSQGINIMIALGHSGYKKDQEIAKNCPEIDIVIGGHSHSFLYGDEAASASAENDENPEVIRGPYPTPIKQSSGKVVPVVQAYAYTKYLGKLHVQFDASGNLIEFDGTPILLNASVSQEQDVLDLLEVYRPNITALDTDILGYTKVNLIGGDLCREQECNLGNLIADSMVHARVLEEKSDDSWTDASVALLQGGGVRSSIQRGTNGSITGTDVLTVLPFGNKLFVLQMTGKTLLNALEHSASTRHTDSNGGFLQVSGLHVMYDYAQPEGSRVASVEVRCANCTVPVYKPLEATLSYKVVMQDFMLQGGDGYSFNEPGVTATPLEKDDAAAFVQYLQQHHFVYPEIEGRINMRGSAAAIVSSLALVAFVSLATQLFN